MPPTGRFFYAIVSGTLPAQTNRTLDERIQHIVDGALKLADRMTALHVPGVSIAVTHGGRIEWARGFGVTRIGGPPVTPGTLFQAASISKPVAALAVLHPLPCRRWSRS